MTRVLCKSKIGDYAKIGDKVKFKKSPLYIIGSKHTINYYGNNKICIGCYIMTFQDWLGEKGKKIAEENRYTQVEKNEYKSYINLIIKRYKLKQ